MLFMLFVYVMLVITLIEKKKQENNIEIHNIKFRLKRFG